MQRLVHASRSLKEWNKKIFSVIQECIKELEFQIENLQRGAQSDSNLQLEKMP